MSDLSDGIVQLALDTATKLPAALSELGGKIDASREASATAHASHAKRLEEFSGVVTSASAVNARLATVLEKAEARMEANAAKVTDAGVDVEIARKKAEEDRLKARAEFWRQVDSWVVRLGALLGAAWFAHQQMTVAANTTTTTATTTITAPPTPPAPADAIH